MHVGKLYPFHFSYWVPTWRYWPGRAPGWAKIDVGGPQVFPELLGFYTMGFSYSLYGEVSVDGQHMTYEFTGLPEGRSILVSCLSQPGNANGLGGMLASFSDPLLGDFNIATETIRPFSSYLVELNSANEWSCWGSTTILQPWTSLIQFAGSTWSEPRP